MRGVVLAFVALVGCARLPESMRIPKDAEVTRVGAGRYAMLLTTEHRGGCSQSNFFSTSRASIVLSLDDDGSARGCRGRRWRTTVESNMPLGEEDPHPDVTELVEQQGMSGGWHARGDVLRIDLALDDAVCPPTRNAASEEARPWSLECGAVAPKETKDGVEPAFPALACHLVDFAKEPGSGAYPHDVGYTVAEHFEFFGGDTIFLAPNPGVVLDEFAAGGLSPDGMRTWRRPAQPIAFDAWSRTE